MRNNSLIRNWVIGVALAVLLPAVAAAQTLDRIKSDGVFNIGYVQDAAPFSYVAAGGQVQGYSIDLCQRVADGVKATLGLSSLNVKYTGTSVSDGLRKLANGSVDILCGSVTDTLQRREKVAFSMTIYNGGTGALISEDAPKALVRVLEGKVAHTGPTWRATINQGLAKHTYAVHKGTVTEEWVRKRIASLGVIATIVEVDEHQQGVDMVANGKADVYFADHAILAYYGKAQGVKVQVLERYANYEPIALGVKRGDADMRLVVDTALSELYLSDGFKAFYASHFGEPSATTLMFFKSFARH